MQTVKVQQYWHPLCIVLLMLITRCCAKVLCYFVSLCHAFHGLFKWIQRNAINLKGYTIEPSFGNILTLLTFFDNILLLLYHCLQSWPMLFVYSVPNFLLDGNVVWYCLAAWSLNICFFLSTECSCGILSQFRLWSWPWGHKRHVLVPESLIATPQSLLFLMLTLQFATTKYITEKQWQNYLLLVTLRYKDWKSIMRLIIALGVSKLFYFSFCKFQYFWL